VVGRASLILPDGSERELEPEFTVGRADDNDLLLEKPTVSRHHIVVSAEGDRWFVEDCNSGLGTSVGGERLTDRRELADGDEIEIGEFSFLVRTAWPNGVA